jgi:DNA-binding transcriptional MerR regulator
MGTKSLLLHSGELAKKTGVSGDTIRHYERIGVLLKMSRTEGGYRLYPESSIERVPVVQRSLRLGFTLAELADVLKAGDAGLAPCNRQTNGSTLPRPCYYSRQLRAQPFVRGMRTPAIVPWVPTLAVPSDTIVCEPHGQKGVQ